MPCVAELLEFTASQPKAITLLSLLLTNTCYAIVGTLLESPDVPLTSTALVCVPFVLSHINNPPSLGLIIKSSPKLSCDHNLICAPATVNPPAAASPQPVKSCAEVALPVAK